MSASLNVFLSTLKVHMKSTLARPMFQVVLIVQPFVVATTTYMVYRDARVDDFTAFVVLGGGLSGIWSALTFSSAGDINRERFYGTLEPMLAGPTRLSWIFYAKISANALLSLIALLIAILYSWGILGVSLELPHPLAFLSALGAFLLSSSTFALCLSTMFLLSRSTLIMQNFLEYPLLLLGGLAFPISILSPWVQGVSAVLPMRWGSQSLRLAMGNGTLSAEFWLALGITALIGLLYGTLALLLFGRIETRVRRLATLNLA
ncbi:MAG: ABC transporter permease [Anaerolineales bacterium]|jgi:ABC-2 type transport system permease protein